ncbi:EboA domain-containing protein [Streptomyces sp. NBC_00006]|uniref:EboA domain-containing protein n=1 Tax=Streptomyces sp. NBC_00006 TaxID=2975619 RepID=UPI00224ED5A3|nr:EboA domain-containing protein [Streptomyces sp. NBC_00006]MCX5530215.1 EboA domain-containing protein [Streptomyces sp. NBC_00006]
MTTHGTGIGKAGAGTLPVLGTVRDRLDAALDATARAWLHAALADAAAHPVSDAPQHALAPWQLRFAEAGRRTGDEHADAVRLLLLHAARADTATLTALYAQGTAAERRAALLALPHLVEGPDALPLIEDALRANDTRLVAAAVGPYAAAHLTDHAWRHAVLKCLFTGVPVDAVAGLADRSRGDGELARMLGDFADERTAAGRPVPDDLHRVLALTAPESLTNGRADPHGKES